MLTRYEWRKLLQTSYDLDVNKGGIYDGRGGCINVWCSPEDQPHEWRWEITKAALNYPREFVGTITPIWDTGVEHVTSFTISSFNYCLHRELERMNPRLAPATMRERCKNRPDEITWVKQKLVELFERVFPGRAMLPMTIDEEAV
ncbi:MAG: hypothetical protein HY709_08910 [Candidatus Latescibacteria bacterium]|nr:hypothetical protein [Candidatus Latescibacterota bacterium]